MMMINHYILYLPVAQSQEHSPALLEEDIFLHHAEACLKNRSTVDLPYSRRLSRYPYRLLTVARQDPTKARPVV